MALNGDKGAGRQIARDQIARHVAPAEARGQKVMLGAQVVDMPLALSDHGHFGLVGVRAVVGDDKLHMPAEFVGWNW